MTQVQNPPLAQDPSILRDIESEVTQETRPLLQFIVNNAKLIVGVVVGLLVALAVAGAWRWHTQSQQEALQGELGQIMHQRATPEQLDALEKLAKDAPARLKAPVYAVQAQSALAQQNYAKAAEAYGRVARSLADMPLGVLGSVNEAASLFGAGKFDEGLKILEPIAARLPKEASMQVRAMLGEAAAKAGRAELAASAFEEVASQSEGLMAEYYRSRAKEVRLLKKAEEPDSKAAEPASPAPAPKAQ